jgi:hypothetical protein
VILVDKLALMLDKSINKSKTIKKPEMEAEMAKVLLWMYSNSVAERLKNSLVNVGYEVVIAAAISNLGPLAKAERQAGTPIEV